MGVLPVVVISPHLDDAVLGCGQLLAERPGSSVVTVLAGKPNVYDLTEWDAECGFRAGEDVVTARREEDRTALVTLQARPVWLEFRDSQYGPAPSQESITGPLEEAILQSGSTSVYLPLGLHHSDHALTHAACLGVMWKQPRLSWFAYEDALYRTLPGLIADRLQTLRGGGVYTQRAFSLAVGTRKREALLAYRSQVRGLSTSGRLGVQDAFRDERFWILVRTNRSDDDRRR